MVFPSPINSRNISKDTCRVVSPRDSKSNQVENEDYLTVGKRQQGWAWYKSKEPVLCVPQEYCCPKFHCQWFILAGDVLIGL